MMFKNLSIKNKLISIIVAVTLFVMGIGFTFHSVKDIETFRQDMLESSRINAELVGNYSVSPLAFEDKKGAKEMLNSLEGVRPVMDGILYDDAGVVFAAFNRSGKSLKIPFPGTAAFTEFSGKFLNVYHLIYFQERYYGSLYLRYSTHLLEEKIQKYLATMIGVMIIMVAVSWLLAARLQGVISKPVLALAKVMERISQGANYSLQVKKYGDDEIGLLYDGFNNMLNQIRLREAERDKAEEDMKRLKNILKNIIDSMPSILVGIDSEERIILWNRGAERMTGLSSDKVQGQILNEVYPRLYAYVKKMGQTAASRKTHKDSKVPMPIDGETRFSDITVYPLTTNGVDGAVIRLDDVTERVRIEEMMIQSEKMMSVGGVAAGMAHEINNPLAGILQNTQNALRRLTTTSPINESAAADCGTSMNAIRCYIETRDIIKMLEAVRTSGSRAAVIVDNMLSFSRKSDSHFSVHSVPGMLDKTIDLVSSDYDLKKKYDFRKIQIQREYAPDLPHILCEESKIQQVILNLLKNAAEAMGGQPGSSDPPRITLRAFNEGSMVRIEVEDNGSSMPEFVRKRVFEPFFTTKEVGVGTGLGLSVSYFIITKNHGGTMSVESVPGKGTTFIIHLPIKRN